MRNISAGNVTAPYQIPEPWRDSETVRLRKQGVIDVKLKRTDAYIIVTINDVNFYFDRETLVYDGMGSSVEDGDVSVVLIKKKEEKLWIK